MIWILSLGAFAGAMLAVAYSVRIQHDATDVPPPPPSPVDPPSLEAKIAQLAQAIAYHGEGFGIGRDIPVRANNPLDLVVGDLGQGTLGPDGVTVFPDVNAGWQAGYNQVRKMLTGSSRVYTLSMTFLEVAHRWTTAADYQDWARGVSNAVGLTPSNTLADFLALGSPA